MLFLYMLLLIGCILYKSVARIGVFLNKILRGKPSYLGSTLASLKLGIFAELRSLKRRKRRGIWP